MIVQCPTFSKSLNSRNIDKPFRISGSVCGSRLKALFGYPHPVTNSLSCLDIQRWATATLEIASLQLSLFAENNSGATPPVTEQK